MPNRTNHDRSYLRLTGAVLMRLLCAIGLALSLAACLPEGSTVVDIEAAEPEAVQAEAVQAEAALDAEAAGEDVSRTVETTASTVEAGVQSDEAAVPATSIPDELPTPSPAGPVEDEQAVNAEPATPAGGGGAVGFGSGGGASLIVDGKRFDLAVPFCLPNEQVLSIAGVGVSGGQEVAGGILLVEGDEGPIVTIELIFGNDPTDPSQPFLVASSLREDDPMDVSQDGSSVTVSGLIRDVHGVMVPAGEAHPFTFAGSCDDWQGPPTQITESTSDVGDVPDLHQAAFEAPTGPFLGQGFIIIEGVRFEFDVVECWEEDGGWGHLGYGSTQTGAWFEIELIGGGPGDGPSDGGGVAVHADAPGMRGAMLPGDSEQWVDVNRGASLSRYGSMIEASGTLTDDKGNFRPVGERAAFTAESSCAFASASNDAEYCILAQAEVDRSNAFGTDPAAALDPDRFAAFWQVQMEALREIVPPQEIAEDYATLKAGAFAADEVFQGNGYSILASLDSVSATIGSQAVIDAGFRIADYNLEVCGIAPAGSGGVFGS